METTKSSVLKRKSTISSLLEIGVVSTRLGFTSFGGPTAHMGYFHEEYVRRRKWMDEQSYADLVALSHFLPGPASSQVGIGIGVMRAGLMGGVIAFLGFTFPSVIALILFALAVHGLDIGNAGWIHGLKIVAVAVVAHAILGMAQKLTPDLKRKAIALLALVATLLWKSAQIQIGVILTSAVIGYFLYNQQKEDSPHANWSIISKKLAAVCLSLFFVLLIVLPILSQVTSLDWVAMFDSFYRSGALVFGGGHVVLPLLEGEFVHNGLVTNETFLAGYGVAQAVPGPLFTFAAYIGAVMNGWAGGVVATVAIFLPAFLLIVGALPFWNSIRSNPRLRGTLMGVNAAVVGILLATLYDPIWTSSILKPIDFALAAILFSMLAYWKLPPWIVVVTGAISGVLIRIQ